MKLLCRIVLINDSLQQQWRNSGCVGNTSVAVSVFDLILVLVAYRKHTRISSYTVTKMLCMRKFS